MSVTLVIPVLNDQAELTATLNSIEATVGRVPVIVVDDVSDRPAVVPDWVGLIRNPYRMGVGASRHVGVVQAQTSHIFFVDAHSRFPATWYDELCRLAHRYPEDLFCGKCLGMGYGVTEMRTDLPPYSAARLLILDKVTREVLEPKWLSKPASDLEEVPCIMGACYLMARADFLDLGGLRSLRGWGCDEIYLSLKWWMSGRKIRFMENVSVGHMFRDVPPYPVNGLEIARNKWMVACELFTDAEAEYLLPWLGLPFGSTQIGMERARFASARAALQPILVHGLEWVCQRWDMIHPTQQVEISAGLIAPVRA